MMPTRHRGWILVLVGGLGASGGYFAVSAASWLWQDTFGWRILFLLNLPTGIVLILLGSFIPESVKFLIASRRIAEAETIMRRFGATSWTAKPGTVRSHPDFSMARNMYPWRTIMALSLAALCWGATNFGLLLWIPGNLQDKGYSATAASVLLTKSASISFLMVLFCALLYSRWSAKWSMVTMIAITALGLGLIFDLELGGHVGPVPALTILIFGGNGMLAILLPYATESFPMRIRGRATGWIAACTKGGGVGAQTLAILALLPGMGMIAALIMAATMAAAVLVAIYGQETRGSDLRNLEPKDEQIGHAEAS